MAKLGDIAGVWNTIRELNVAEIRDHAEQAVAVALVGDPPTSDLVARVLRGSPGRFPAASRDALLTFDLTLPRDRQADLVNANVVLLAIDGSQPLSAEAITTADKLVMLRQPRVVAILGSEQVPHGVNRREIDLAGARVVFVPDPTDQAIRERVLPLVADAVADNERVALARRLPGLRDTIGQMLIRESAVSNATYALTSGLPEMIPLLNLPLNAADILVLTKNQALLAYKLGLAYGAPPDFQSQMREIMPVIGGGFVWRQIARQLIGLIPGFGLLPKVAVAYAGTYAVGQSAALWYSQGEVFSRAGLRQLYRRALHLGKERGRELVDENNAAPSAPAEPQPGGLAGRLGRLLGRKPPLPPPPTG